MSAVTREKDPLAIGLGALACGAGLGGGTIIAALLVVQGLQRRLDPTSYRQAAADPLVLGLLAGIAVGAAFGWRKSRALENLWQRGVIAPLGDTGIGRGTTRVTMSMRKPRPVRAKCRGAACCAPTSRQP